MSCCCVNVTMYFHQKSHKYIFVQTNKTKSTIVDVSKHQKKKLDPNSSPKGIIFYFFNPPWNPSLQPSLRVTCGHRTLYEFIFGIRTEKNLENQTGFSKIFGHRQEQNFEKPARNSAKHVWKNHFANFSKFCTILKMRNQKIGVRKP